MNVTDEIKAKVAQLQEMLEALHNGRLYIGARSRGGQK
jgi:hypothetical protein